jgi:acyl carrier protein
VGGLGELGGAFAEFLARRGVARLALVEPPGLPPRANWDEWLAHDGGSGVVSRKIRRLRALEERGCAVELIEAEGDEAEAWSAAASAAARSGPLDGALVLLDADDHAGERRPPLERARSLQAALHALDGALGESAGLRLAVWSLADARRGSGEAARALCLDAFAGSSAAHGARPWASVTWDLPPLEPGGSLPSEAALERVFALQGAPQVIVAPRALAAGWHKLVALRAADARPAAPRGLGSYARPANLRSAYVAPRSAAEEQLAALWRDLLGVAQVGLHDSFLELGGDSLLATRLMARLREQWDLDLPLRLIFEASTVAELAAALERLTAEKEARELDELVREIEGLSEEDAERELARRQAGSGA